MAVAAPNTPPLEAPRIQRQLQTVAYGRSLELHDRAASTNDLARVAAQGGVVTGHVVLADQQTAGRGSHGRTWSSPAGSDLYLSIVDRPPLRLADLPPLTLAVGLGVADCIAERLPDTTVAVKWPNDVLVAGRKCAGILVEASSLGDALQSLAIGIGLNVNRTTFPADLQGTATSMRLASGVAQERNAVVAALLGHVERQVQRLVQEGTAAIAAALQSRLAMRGQLVQCEGVRGELLGVAPSGALRIRTQAGERLLVSGRLKEDSHG